MLCNGMQCFVMICTYVHTYVCMYGMYFFLPICLFVCLSVCPSVFLFVCLSACLYLNVYMILYAYLHACRHIFMHNVYVYIYIVLYLHVPCVWFYNTIFTCNIYQHNCLVVLVFHRWIWDDLKGLSCQCRARILWIWHAKLPWIPFERVAKNALSVLVEKEGKVPTLTINLTAHMSHTHVLMFIFRQELRDQTW